MKKTILLILAVLPIILVIIIAFAGRILSIYQHIPVERVEFINEDGDPYNADMEFVVDMGQSRNCDYKIYPELSSNKKVTFTSSDESICTVDDKGLITGVHYGFATIMIKTEDGGKTALLNVIVTADIPIGVEIVTHGDANTPQIPMDSLELIAGEEYNLDIIVNLPVALDKSVTFVSSDPTVVTVDATGTLVAVGEGTATITVTTVSGDHSDTCEITVVKGELPIAFDMDAIAALDGVEIVNGVCVVSSADVAINLLDVLLVRDDIDPTTVQLAINSVQGVGATLNNGVLNMDGFGLVVVRAYVGNKSNPTYFADIKVALR